MAPLDRLNVKSVSATATDAHERGKDFLSETEIAVLLDAAKAGRHGVRDRLVSLAMYRLSNPGVFVRSGQVSGVEPTLCDAVMV